MANLEDRLNLKSNEDLIEIINSDDFSIEEERFAKIILKERGVDTKQPEIEKNRNILIKCSDCSNEISREATSCPKCGKPNKIAQSKKRYQIQKAGCLLIIIGIILLLISFLFGGIAIVLVICPQNIYHFLVET